VYQFPFLFWGGGLFQVFITVVFSPDDWMCKTLMQLSWRELF